MKIDKGILERARWIIEHGADKRKAPEAEVGVPLYIEEYPAAPAREEKRETEYVVEF